MNLLSKIFRLRPNEFRDRDFKVRIESIFRENISVIHTREGKTVNFDGERYGKKWDGVQVYIPEDVERAQLQQIVCDLETAFKAMQHKYVILRKASVEIVTEEERQAALTELHQMGFQIELSADRKQIRQTRRPDAPLHDKAALRKMAPRMMSLIQSLKGTRQRFEVLAKSPESAE
jgi:hypothetical protein